MHVQVPSSARAPQGMTWKLSPSPLLYLQSCWWCSSLLTRYIQQGQTKDLVKDLGFLLPQQHTLSIPTRISRLKRSLSSRKPLSRTLLSPLKRRSLVRQYRRITHFYRRHAGAVWQPATPPDSRKEMDDLLLVLGHRCLPCLCSIQTREQGSFEPPGDQIAEPRRTQRLLRRAFSWPVAPWGGLLCCIRLLKGRTHPMSPKPNGFSTHLHHGSVTDDAFEYLPVWLNDAPGTSLRKTRYIFVLTVLQLWNALVTGTLYATPFLLTTPGGMFLLGCQALSAALAAGWAATRTANDILDGFEKCICYMCEFVSISLVLAAAYISSGVWLSRLAF